MRFITIIAALATTIAPTSGAANALDPRSDVPCRPEQEMDLRCGAFAIVRSPGLRLSKDDS